MNAGKSRVLIMIGGAAVVGAVAFGIFVFQKPVEVPTSTVQGAIGERNVYRDSSTTGASVDANSTKEFEKLYRIGRFKALANDPNFKQLAVDKSFFELLDNNDFQALMANADFMALVRSGDLQRLKHSKLAFERAKKSLELERNLDATAMAFERLNGNPAFLRLLDARKFDSVFMSKAFMNLMLEKNFVESMATMRIRR